MIVEARNGLERLVWNSPQVYGRPWPQALPYSSRPPTRRDRRETRLNKSNLTLTKELKAVKESSLALKKENAGFRDIRKTEI